ncbi:hypothetical protein CEUSTIGMA_g8518.t1 [Chlamydomonas eustigma]|uniref:Uncharacterized protein n=1 Tax=Chlamydomonas eustigma TaxID=1157962 RepID=A0A250XDC3_9CHLO|nr:hypothetical protein CEUSTIGMA_g8518.t1 [Chlamydomonas eustigma]|eukprot:GAX81084.1 hypothetical protein CEUSTIGMA_g8518.t1 [Chlamydomonas eustigma]
METILKASYGDARQREANQKPKEKDVAGKILKDFYLQKAANPRKEVPTPPRQSGPPLWNPKIQGDVHIGHGHRPEPKYANVEIRPGAFHMVELPSESLGSPSPRPGAAARKPPETVYIDRRGRPLAGAVQAGGGRIGAVSPHAAAAAAKRVARPLSAPAARGRLPAAAVSNAAGALPYQVDTTQLAPDVVRFEEVLRHALHQHAALHVKEKTVLMRAFGKVLGKKYVDISQGDKVDTSQFTQVCRELGVQLSPQHAYAVFNKYGQDARGKMPVLNFVDALMYGATRQIMLENDYVQHGAFKAGAPATHTGKIKYPQCKKGVWPPSNWDPRLAERSSELPDIRLQLEFVYGYDGMQATAPNLFYTKTGDVAYFAAAVGIVYNKESHSQRFFLGHDDDILCMAMHPDMRTVATGQVGKDPDVVVWDSMECREIQRISQGYGNRGITACCFSPDGSKLVCICMDNNHTMYIWDWKKKKALMSSNTFAGVPPSTYGVLWSKFEPEKLVTYGQNHIKFWSLGTDTRTGDLTNQSKSGVFSSTKTHTVLSACFLQSGIVLSGNQAGCLCSWKNARIQRETPAHATGPMTQRPDGSKMYGGLRCLVLQSSSVLLSGGADGYVIKWDITSGDLGPALQRIPLLRPEQMGKMVPPALRGLDCYPGSNFFIAGSSSCDLWEVDDTPEVLIQGQAGDLNGLAMNPAYPHVFATISEADTVAVFSALTRKPLRVVQIAGKGEMARSGAFSMDGQHLAIGLSGGGIKIMEFHPNVAQVAWIKDSEESIDELKYSPCGRYLAAGSHDQIIYIYDKLLGYKRVTRCIGHSSTVTHFDWSADSSVLQSNDQAYELLYFDPRTGRQVKENQRDTVWATWTCTLGFDVMGIWPPYSDGTDVNACDRSPSGRYLLTADDFGKVKLFNHPVVVQHAPALVYGGHSSFVPNVRWSVDETFACSVGGRDRCTFQFRVYRDQTAPPAPAYGFMPLDKQGITWSDPGLLEAQQRKFQKAGIAQAPAAGARGRPVSARR